MTPAEKAGITEHVYCRVIEGVELCRGGSLVKLCFDDNTFIPLFEVIHGDCYSNQWVDGKPAVYLRLDEVEPILSHEEKAMTNETNPDPVLMREIAKAMEEDPENWFKRFQFYDDKWERWVVCLIADVLWHSIKCGDVRLKPQTYTLHVEDMPLPLKEKPDIGQVYWTICLSTNLITCHHWHGGVMENKRFKRGLCFATRDNAQATMMKLTSAMKVQ